MSFLFAITRLRDCRIRARLGFRDDMFEHLREHCSNEQIVELIMRIVLTSLFNTIKQALDIELEEGMITIPLAEGLEETG